MNIQRSCVRYGKAIVAGAVVAAFLLFVNVPLAQAENRSRCQRQVEKAEARLNRAIARHGERSSQAREARRDLNSQRGVCWDRHHAWYNGQDRQWHTERDWDRDQNQNDHGDRDHRDQDRH